MAWLAVSWARFDQGARLFARSPAAHRLSVVRQSGNHIRLQAEERKPHALTIPNHSPLKLGSLSAVLNDIARHRDMDKEELLQLLFGK